MNYLQILLSYPEKETPNGNNVHPTQVLYHSSIPTKYIIYEYIYMTVKIRMLIIKEK